MVADAVKHPSMLLAGLIFASIPQTKRGEDRAILSRGCGGIATTSLEMAL
jgi:hypothetical protein